jgi:hypothetical protein
MQWVRMVMVQVVSWLALNSAPVAALQIPDQTANNSSHHRRLSEVLLPLPWRGAAGVERILI